MYNDIKKLTKEFENIKKLGWIKSKRKGTTGIGYTFETLLGKIEENFEIPDYNSIEIKTKHKYSKGYITLFNCNPDGDILFPIERILNQFGCEDKNNYKKFNFSIFNNKWTLVGNNKKIKLNLNDKDKKLELIATNLYNNKIITDISWSYDILKEKLERKNKILAIIKAENKFSNNIEYFKYYDIKFYKLKSFKNFINLIDKGIIRVTFKIGTFKSGKREGQVHNHGTGFDINEKDLLYLYDEIK